jgi:hypothetical protein
MVWTLTFLFFTKNLIFLPKSRGMLIGVLSDQMEKEYAGNYDMVNDATIAISL